MNENQFWMVYIEGDGVLPEEHDTFDDARLAAERLLTIPGYHGQKAYIVSPCCYGQTKPFVSSVIWHYPAATEEEK